MAIAALLLMGAVLTLPYSMANMGDPGPHGDTEPIGPGPMRDQETRQKELDHGYRFKYGMETPATSIEDEKNGNGLSIDVLHLRFRNLTNEMSMILAVQDWDVSENEEGNTLAITYETWNNWMKDGEETGIISKITIKYTYHQGDSDESIDYSVDIEDVPGEGELLVVLRSASTDGDQGCCWAVEEVNMVKRMNMFTLTDRSGNRISTMEVPDRAKLISFTGTEEVETNISSEIINETAVVTVGSQIHTDTETFSISGSLSFLDGFKEFLSNTAEDTADFVMDHLYSFIMGAAVVLIITTVLLVISARKKVQTDGMDLDLGKNRYYKGD
ncbi:MAG: hypothetical protein U9R75_12830 [Candidatus Thermoplasmatota archaeon]|nr:hypothetical protein [Candidatus Thermoplasmatota archaeon]